jgi:hypothetical protein
MANKQWNDVELAIQEGRMEDAGNSIASIIHEENTELDWSDIRTLTEAIQDTSDEEF